MESFLLRTFRRKSWWKVLNWVVVCLSNDIWIINSIILNIVVDSENFWRVIFLVARLDELTEEYFNLAVVAGFIDRNPETGIPEIDYVSILQHPDTPIEDWKTIEDILGVKENSARTNFHSTHKWVFNEDGVNTTGLLERYIYMRARTSRRKILEDRKLELKQSLEKLYAYEKHLYSESSVENPKPEEVSSSLSTSTPVAEPRAEPTIPLPPAPVTEPQRYDGRRIFTEPPDVQYVTVLEDQNIIVPNIEEVAMLLGIHNPFNVRHKVYVRHPWLLKGEEETTVGLLEHYAHYRASKGSRRPTERRESNLEDALSKLRDYRGETQTSETGSSVATPAVETTTTPLPPPSAPTGPPEISELSLDERLKRGEFNTWEELERGILKVFDDTLGEYGRRVFRTFVLPELQKKYSDNYRRAGRKALRIIDEGSSKTRSELGPYFVEVSRKLVGRSQSPAQPTRVVPTIRTNGELIDYVRQKLPGNDFAVQLALGISKESYSIERAAEVGDRKPGVVKKAFDALVGIGIAIRSSDGLSYRRSEHVSPRL